MRAGSNLLLGICGLVGTNYRSRLSVTYNWAQTYTFLGTLDRQLTGGNVLELIIPAPTGLHVLTGAFYVSRLNAFSF